MKSFSVTFQVIVVLFVVVVSDGSDALASR